VSDNQELLDKLQESIDLHHKQIKTMQELRRLVMLSNIMDMPIKEITGKVSTSVHDVGRRLHARPWGNLEFVIKLDGEEVVRKKLVTVPTEFWPDDVRANYERQLKRRKDVRNDRV